MASPTGTTMARAPELPVRRHLVVTILHLVMGLYDFITFPIYVLFCSKSFFARLFKPMSKQATIHTARINASDPYSAYKRTDTRFTDHYAFQATTIPELMELSLKNNSPKMPSLGQRTVKNCTPKEDPQLNKIISQVELSGYWWHTLEDVDMMVEQLAKAFINQGIQFQERVLIYSETRPEWFLCAQAVFRIGAVVTTLFSTLGETGIIHGINETEVEHIILTEDLVPGLLKIIDQLPTVKFLYVIENDRKVKSSTVAEEDIEVATGGRVKMINYKDLFCFAQEIPMVATKYLEDRKVKPDDIAVVLYTSGSTGRPKGVVQTHRNFITVCQGLYSLYGASIMNNAAQHTYFAFLPLAHTFELIAEMVFFGAGICIGYGTPLTMTDTSPGLQEGELGDLRALRPTIMCSVPLVLDRIRAKLMERIAGSSGKQEAFQFLLDYKKKWTNYGMSTPLMNLLISKKAQKVLGGRVQFMIVGGAPLSAETQEIVQSVLNIKVLIGYGMTETCAACFVSDFKDNIIGTTSLLHGCQFRLNDWIQGGYRATDVPNPRGELVIGGPSVANGYFKQTALTEASFEVDEQGTQWFMSGDIAEVTPEGTIRIIDRKKDLLKLPNGEYVSVGKIESELKCFPYLEHIAVYGNPLRHYLVAIASPNILTFKALAMTMMEKYNPNNSKLEVLCEIDILRNHVLGELKQYCAKVGLSRAETPQRLKLCSDEWSVANGLLTASMKINRNNIRAFYKDDIEALFTE